MSEGLKYEAWLKRVCFQEPTPEAYDLAKDAWNESANALSEELEELKNNIDGNYIHCDEIFRVVKGSLETLTYSQSPIELVTQIIDEKDELTQRLADVEKENAQKEESIDALRKFVQESHMAGEVNGLEKVLSFVHNHYKLCADSLAELKEENEQALSNSEEKGG